MSDKTSKTRMNLAAIKKVDPYAKDIVDSSSHVAFYTFNSTQNEWEKTDVEGVFFLYSRNAQPYYSIFINNRLNTTSFVEPITNQLELQSQPPFLLYRNERSRIRGFWFYNSQECGRIGELVSKLVQETGSQSYQITAAQIEKPEEIKESNSVNIFKMLSKAQQEYNSQNQQNTTEAVPSIAAAVISNNNNSTKEQAPCNVMNFFASAKPTTAKVPLLQRLLPNTLSVEQLEKQQRVLTPSEPNQILLTPQKPFTPPQWLSFLENNVSHNFTPQASLIGTSELTLDGSHTIGIQKPLDFDTNSKSPEAITTVAEKENLLRQLLVADAPPPPSMEHNSKPALMPPTMFDKPNRSVDAIAVKQQPLDKNQMVQAFSYLLQNDEEFVQKLHDTYLKVCSKASAGLYQ